MNIKVVALLLVLAILCVSFVESVADPGKKYGGSSHAPYYKKYKKHYYHYHHHYHNHKHKHKHSHKHKHKYTQSSAGHGHSSNGYSGQDDGPAIFSEPVINQQQQQQWQNPPPPAAGLSSYDYQPEIIEPRRTAALLNRPSNNDKTRPNSSTHNSRTFNARLGPTASQNITNDSYQQHPVIIKSHVTRSAEPNNSDLLKNHNMNPIVY